MSYLVDTHLLLWARIAPERLSLKCKQILTDSDAELFFSVVTLWEVAIKFSLGRTDFTVDPQTLRMDLLDNDYKELPVLAKHALMIGTLPPIHRDPFDRMLVAQAVAEDVTLLTADKIIARYTGPIQLM